MFTDATLGDLDNAINDALGALREIAKSKNASAEVRVQAATSILDFATELFGIGQAAAGEEDYDDEDFDEDEE